MPSKIIDYAKDWNVPHGKTLVITSGNSGIGFEVLRHVLRRGFRVYMGLRNLEKGEVARKKLLEEFPEADITIWHLDLSSSQSIRDFCDKIIDSHLDFDVFYANAGVYRIPYRLVEHGIEETAYVNFVANFLLYEALKDYARSLPHPVKWILTSSITARFARFRESDFFGGKKYKKAPAYARSKVAVNMLFQHMRQQCHDTNIIPLLVHPGTTHTPLIEKAYPQKGFRRAAEIFLRSVFHSPEKASLSTLYLLRDEVQEPCFCGPRGPFHLSGYPVIYRLYSRNLKNQEQIFTALADILAKE